MVVHDAKINNGDPKRALVAQMPPLRLGNGHNKALEYLDTIPFATELNSPRWVTSGFVDSHPHGWLPTKRWHRLTVVLMRFSATPVALTSAPESQKSGQVRHRDSCQWRTYQLHQLPSVRGLTIASDEWGNHRQVREFAKLERVVRGVVRFGSRFHCLAIGDADDTKWWGLGFGFEIGRLQSRLFI